MSELKLMLKEKIERVIQQVDFDEEDMELFRSILELRFGIYTEPKCISEISHILCIKDSDVRDAENIFFDTLKLLKYIY